MEGRNERGESGTRTVTVVALSGIALGVTLASCNPGAMDLPGFGNPDKSPQAASGPETGQNNKHRPGGRQSGVTESPTASPTESESTLPEVSPSASPSDVETPSPSPTREVIISLSPTPTPSTTATEKPKPTDGITNPPKDKDPVDDQIDNVLVVSLDGFTPKLLDKLGKKGLPNLFRIIGKSTFTLNARTDHDATITLPNHESMMTGRPVLGEHGHQVTFDADNHKTSEQTAGKYIKSMFDVVHDNGGSTAVYTSKKSSNSLIVLGMNKTALQTKPAKTTAETRSTHSKLNLASN